jgi:hypothetical protein
LHLAVDDRARPLDGMGEAAGGLDRI